MAVVVGIFVGQDWSGIPLFEAGAAPGAVAPFSFGSLLRTKLHLTGSVESKRCGRFLQPSPNLSNGLLHGQEQQKILPMLLENKATLVANSLIHCAWPVH